MFLDQENATNVPEEGTSQTPAETAAIEEKNSSSAPGRTSSPAAGQETLVSQGQAPAEDLDKRISAAIEKYFRQAAPLDSDELKKLIEETVAEAVENMKADLIAYVKSLFASSRPAPAFREINVEEEEPLPFEAGDRVKVFADPEKKTFHKGTVSAVHGDGHAYDVVLDEGGATTVPAGGVAELVE